MDGRIEIQWTDGNGNIVIEKTTEGANVSSDSINDDVDRQQSITFKTIVGNATETRLVKQQGSLVYLADSDGVDLYDVNDIRLKGLKV